jgi:hypothetical protein
VVELTVMLVILGRTVVPADTLQSTTACLPVRSREVAGLAAEIIQLPIAAWAASDADEAGSSSNFRRDATVNISAASRCRFINPENEDKTQSSGRIHSGCNAYSARCMQGHEKGR